jgi:hypothetical protein
MIASISAAVAERGLSVDIRADLLLSEGVPIETLAGCSVRQRFPAWGWYNGIVIGETNDGHAVQWDDGTTTSMKRSAVLKYAVPAPLYVGQRVNGLNLKAGAISAANGSTYDIVFDDGCEAKGIKRDDIFYEDARGAGDAHVVGSPCRRSSRAGRGQAAEKYDPELQRELDRRPVQGSSSGPWPHKRVATAVAAPTTPCVKRPVKRHTPAFPLTRTSPKKTKREANIESGPAVPSSRQSDLGGDGADLSLLPTRKIAHASFGQTPVLATPVAILLECSHIKQGRYRYRGVG